MLERKDCKTKTLYFYSFGFYNRKTISEKKVRYLIGKNYEGKEAYSDRIEDVRENDCNLLKEDLNKVTSIGDIGWGITHSGITYSIISEKRLTVEQVKEMIDKHLLHMLDLYKEKVETEREIIAHNINTINEVE